MMFMGIWPEHRSFSRASSYKVIVAVLIMFCFCCAPQSANLPFILDDFDLVVENLSMANVTVTLSLLKIITFWSNGGPLKMLVSYMKKDWSTTVDKRDRKTMLDIANITRKLSIRSTVFSNSVVMLCIVFWYVNTRQTGRQMLLPAYFPYNMTSSPSYELTLFGQFASGFYAATSYAAVDTFIATLVLHICGQLSNLRRELINLCAYTKTEFQAKLENIVRRHEYLNRFAEMIEDSFNTMLLVQMLGCSMQLCFQCLQAFVSIMDEMDEIFIIRIIFLSIYVAYILLQLYLYCYIGEKLFVEPWFFDSCFLWNPLNLTFQSTKIADAAYDCSWYNLSAREARLLMIIMYRARSPLQITAGRFCSFNRELFSEVLKRSVAYMSCIYAMNSFE